MQTKLKISLHAIAVLLLIISPESYAHSDVASLQGGFSSGFMHPVSGLDHVVAMIAVGLWGTFLGKPSIWVLPVVFPIIMALGAVLGIVGITVPYPEVGIALSDIVLGFVVLFAVRPPLWVAAMIVAIFAIFHGYAHGTELPNAANPLVYSLGFVIATGLLHLAGIAFGELKRFSYGEKLIRTGGALVMLVGFGFMFNII